MILRHIPRKDWEAKLRRHGCEPLEGKGKLNTAEWWKSPKGYPFTVPIEGGKKGYVDFWALHKICEQHGIEKPKLEDKS